jgi:hypothetical protein
LLTILDAINDPKLFGPWFEPKSSWLAWTAFLAALFGLPMTTDERGEREDQASTGRQELIK